MSAPLSQNRRTGTVLLFFLAAMVVVSTYVTTMLRSQADTASGVSTDELRLVADTMALSGIELMATIAGNAAEGGPTFLSDRERSLGVSTPYSLDRLFSFPTGVPGTYYVPPLEYPPLKDVALNITPTNQPPYIQDTDILLLNASEPTRIPASNYYLIMEPTRPPSGFAGPSILPNDLFAPLSSDGTNYTTPGCVNDGSHWRIPALEPGACNVRLGWYGDKNGAGYLPVTASRYTGYTGCQKMRPPSFVLGRTHQAAFGATYRTFLYAWYVQSNAIAPPAPERQWYYMTSGRVREIRNASGTIGLGPEVAVSNTQLR
jgi:hypothetical protein